MRWAEIQVETTAAAHEAVAETFIENGCGGAAIQGDVPILVKAYLPVDDRLEGRLAAIQSRIRELPALGVEAGTGELTVKHVEEQEWAEAWREYFRTARIGRRIVIRPPWEKYHPIHGDVVVEIEPGMAFGTGAHPTTRMSLEALEKYLRRGMRGIDFGTGSGILAIAAAKLGAPLVIALDADETAVRAARENVIRNGIEERIEVHRADNLKFISDKVDLVTANIVAHAIIANAVELARVLRTGGILIAAGIASDKEFDVEQALRNERFDIAEKMTEGEWVTLVAHKAG